MCALLRGFEQKMALLNFDKCSNDFPFPRNVVNSFPESGNHFHLFFRVELNLLVLTPLIMVIGLEAGAR